MPLVPAGNVNSGRRHGFTLIEMLLVMSIIALMAAIAAPELMPAILMSQLEGTARHVAGYGRAVMSQATLMRETITVTFDLVNQEYWAIRRVNKSKSIFEEDTEKSQGQAAGNEKTAQQKAKNPGAGNNSEFLNLLGYSRSEDDGSNWGESATSGAGLMRKQFDQFAQAQMLERSKDVKREGLLDEIGPLFDKKFSLDDEEEVEEEVMDPLLSRTTLPSGVKIESIYVGGAASSKGEVSIEVTPLGLAEPVTFYIKNEDDDYFTVKWDPITGNVHLQKGKQDAA